MSGPGLDDRGLEAAADSLLPLGRAARWPYEYVEEQAAFVVAAYLRAKQAPLENAIATLLWTRTVRGQGVDSWGRAQGIAADIVALVAESVPEVEEARCEEFIPVFGLVERCVRGVGHSGYHRTRGGEEFTGGDTLAPGVEREDENG